MDYEPCSELQLVMCNIIFKLATKWSRRISHFFLFILNSFFICGDGDNPMLEFMRSYTLNMVIFCFKKTSCWDNPSFCWQMTSYLFESKNIGNKGLLIILLKYHGNNNLSSIQVIRLNFFYCDSRKAKKIGEVGFQNNLFLIKCVKCQVSLKMNEVPRKVKG